MAETTKPSDVLRARRIELVDSRGVLRALLSVTDDDGFNNVSLGLYDDRGKERATLNTSSESAGLELWEGGNLVAYLGSTQGGEASVVLSDVDGQPVTVIRNRRMG